MLLVKLIEPPCTEPYARWCERSGKFISDFPSYSIEFSSAQLEINYLFKGIFLLRYERKFLKVQTEYVIVITEQMFAIGFCTGGTIWELALM